MKTKRPIFIIFIAALLMPLLHACLDDDTTNHHQLTIGTIKVVDGQEYYFALDEGTKMYPGDTTNIHNYTVVPEQRAFVYFDLLEEKVSGYDYNAAIYRIENILTKDIYLMPAEKEDSIGDDRINITNMWIANDHLNIQYQIHYDDTSNKSHMLNLIVNEAADDKNNKEDYLTLEFRHNAYGEAQRKLGPGIVSFRLNNIRQLAEGKRGLNIRVNTLYNGISYQTIDFQ